MKEMHGHPNTTYILTFFGECPYKEGDLVDPPLTDDLDQHGTVECGFIGKAKVISVRCDESERKRFTVTLIHNLLENIGEVGVPRPLPPTPPPEDKYNFG